LIAANPHATFARIAAMLHPVPAAPAGVHASAVVDPTAVIDPSAHVGPQAVIGARARVGARCVVGAGSIVGAETTIGDDTRLVARVTILERVVIGARVLVHPGAVLGAEGFGFAREGEAWLHVPQIGGLRIGDDVEIGANTTIDRGALDDTVIGAGVKIDNLRADRSQLPRSAARTAIARLRRALRVVRTSVRGVSSVAGSASPGISKFATMSHSRGLRSW
jgi:UDP-3-O-[3-hydroxymyristoyl] glucosamine N-acyltransferase